MRNVAAEQVDKNLKGESLPLENTRFLIDTLLASLRETHCKLVSKVALELLPSYTAISSPSNEPCFPTPTLILDFVLSILTDLKS